MARPLMCVSAALVGAALAGTSLVRAQSGRAMTIDDLLAAVRVADPQLSPDGRTVLYVRTTTDLARRPAQRGHLARAGRRLGAGRGVDRRRAQREHAALLERRTPDRVHLQSRAARRRSSSPTPTAAACAR